MHVKSLILAIAIFAVSLVVPALAHHSHGNYNITSYIKLSGVIKEVHWNNPHSWVYVEVTDEKGGEPTIWAMEGASSFQLQRRGWTKDSLKIGSPISVRCHQLRDGSNGCLLGFITLPDGVEKEFD